jgi:class 3 adenylate cyclase/tetratricopeptide (TPR) repeat protein
LAGLTASAHRSARATDRDIDARLLSPYAPRPLIVRLAERPDALAEEVEGTVVFVDVSGFTKLSERLARRGTVGAEELTEAIESCFAGLLAFAYANGGSLLKFGGDALLLLFSDDGHVARACRSAVGMRRTLRDIGKLETSAGKVVLRMSVGVHTGRFHLFLVGGSHRELIVAGPAASQAVRMEHAADAGEIVVSHATAAALPDGLLGAGKGPGRLLRRSPAGDVATPVQPEYPLDANGLLRCVPLALRDHVLSGASDAEHRQATVAFLRFDGTDELTRAQGAAAVGEALDELVRDVQRQVDASGLCFLATDVDDDGGKIILTGGVPRATGNDEERMLLALRAIAVGSRTLPVRIGVHRGAVFAGDIGPPYRRTYTIMGDTVNLAARLMAAAPPGAILATRDVLDRSQTCFGVERLEPFFVKGKTRPVGAYSVGDASGTRVRLEHIRTPLQGRGAEMAALRAALYEARDGRGRLVEIVGEAGIGKSRLLEEVKAEAQELAFLTATCELYRASTPYDPFRQLLEEALRGAVAAPPDADVADLLRRFVSASTPRLAPWLPLLAIPLDVEVPQTAEAEALDEQFRRSRLHDAVLEFLSALLPEPTVLAIEDAHLMDEASAELLAHIARGIGERPWLSIVTRRTGRGGFAAPEDSSAVTIEPRQLDEDQAIAVLEAATADEPLRPQQLRQLAVRSGGNPLLLRELLAASGETGTVEGIPDSIEALMMSRIDRLAPDDRTLLRRASVLGSSFPSALVPPLLDEDMRRPTRADWERLGEFIELRAGGTLFFRRALLRDAAYEGLPFRRRRELHERAGVTIEARASDPEDEAEVLSLHFYHARRYEDAWRYSRIAGDRAKAKYAPVEAAEFYQRAIDAARNVGGIPSVDLAGAYETLGDVRDRAGQYAAAGAAYRSARRLVSGDPVHEARLLLKQAYIPEREGRYAEAIRWIGKGLRTLEGTSSVEARRQRAQLSVWHAAVRQLQGRSAEAIRWCSRAIEDAERSGDRDALAHAYYVLDWAYAELGRFDEVVHSQRALEIYGELDDLVSQASVYNNLGGFAYFQGRWDQAIELYERARDARLRVGDPVNAVIAALNVGEILSDQAKFDEAERCFRQALQVWRAAGHQEGVAFATSFLGRIATRKGEFDEALRLLRDARALFARTGAGGEVLDTDALIAEALSLQGRYDEAATLASETLQRAAAGRGQTHHAPLLHRVLACRSVQRGDAEEAVRVLSEALDIARSRSASFEVAQTLDALAAVRRLRDEPDAAAADERESRELYRALGVEEPPAVPWPAGAIPQSGSESR